MLIKNDFEVAAPLDKVWQFFDNIPQVAACLLAGQPPGHPGLPDEHDLQFALGCRVADPVVEAASLQQELVPLLAGL